LKVKTKDFNLHEQFVMNTKGSAVFACNQAGKTGSTTNAAVCHYIIRNVDPKAITNFSGGYHMKSDGARELWDFLTSPSGPYRKLFEFCGQPQLIGSSEDDIRGFTLSDKAFQYPTYPLLYGFFINTRIPSEGMAHLKPFTYLVRKGYDPALAFLYSKHLNYDPKLGLMTGSRFWTGGHEALSETLSVGKIDVKGWCTGEHKETPLSSSASSLAFRLYNPKKGAPLMQQLAWSSYTLEQKSGIGGRVRVVPEDQELKMFEDWKKLVELRY
jgi:hypothetical protein